MDLHKSVKIVLFFILTVLNSEDTFEIETTYADTECKVCTNEDLYFVRLVQFSMHDCVNECARRRKCQALNYLRRLALCELLDFNNKSNAYARKGECVYVKKNDIHVSGEPVICSSCSDKEACDWDKEQCMIEECPRFTLDGIVLQGNMNSVGNRIKYTCKQPEYEKMVRDEMYSTCDNDGSWKPQPRCELNVALRKRVSMSSLHNYLSYPENGVDGRTYQYWIQNRSNSCFHTKIEMKPWWQVDLGAVFKIMLVRLFNRIDNYTYSLRTKNVTMSVGNSSDSMVDVGYKDGQMKVVDEFIFVPEIFAQFVKIWLNQTNTVMFHLCEVQVLGKQ